MHDLSSSLLASVATSPGGAAVCTPSEGDIAKKLRQFVNNIFDIAAKFVRWQNGTCIDCPSNSQDNKYTYAKVDVLV